MPAKSSRVETSNCNYDIPHQVDRVLPARNASRSDAQAGERGLT